MNTKDLVKKYNFKFTKSLGQNFLIDETVLYDIVGAADITKEDYIIEIGPGVGTLTNELLNKAKKVTAIELDKQLIPILTQEMEGKNNFELVNKDALKVDYNDLIGEEKSVKVVANLPYYVTTPIINKLITGEYNLKSIIIMIQREVAERINSKPNCKQYGALSILVQYYCDTSIVRIVPPSAFVPQPKVESVVIKLDKLSKPRVSPKNEKIFFTIVREAFNLRRKTLWNVMKKFKLDSEDMEKVFETAQIDKMRRGETLSLEEFCKLSDSYYELINN